MPGVVMLSVGVPNVAVPLKPVLKRFELGGLSIDL
jgi:hypothetical protein